MVGYDGWAVGDGEVELALEVGGPGDLFEGFLVGCPMQCQRSCVRAGSKQMYPVGRAKSFF